MKVKRIPNFTIIASGFAILALVGALLLMLPVSSANGSVTPFFTALFTSVSASCVTGLVLVDTAVHWSLFGQLVILALIQIGGLGFISIATFFLTFTKKRLNLQKRSIMAESINTSHIAGMKKITRHIILGTVFFEGIGAVLLSFRFIPDFGFLKGIYYSVFHSVSAFCNAGFDLMGINGEFISFAEYSDDLLVNLTLISLITIGGIGFLVWDDIYQHKLSFRRYNFHTKLVLVTSLVLTFGGAILYFILEQNYSLAGKGIFDKIICSLFSSVTCRTAGFNTTDFSMLSHSSILLMCILMFVGGSSGSTAGGVKTTSIAVIFSYLFSGLRGIEKPVLFGRTFEKGTLKKAVTVCVFNFSLILVSVMIICSLQDIALQDVLFEVFSAMGTVGMTTGITRQLEFIPRLIIIILMYLGRVGSISFALTLLEKKSQPPVHFPTESITVG